MDALSLSESDIKDIKETVNAFTRCLVSQDFARWVTHWAEDGVLMPPGRPRVSGHKSLVEFIQKHYPDVQSFELSDWKVMGEGDWSAVSNNIRWTAGPSKQATAAKQIMVLNKDSAQKWRFKAIIFNEGV